MGGGAAIASQVRQLLMIKGRPMKRGAGSTQQPMPKELKGRCTAVKQFWLGHQEHPVSRAYLLCHSASLSITLRFGPLGMA